MKLTKFISIVLLFLFLFTLKFTLSSSNKWDEPETPIPTDCDRVNHDEDETTNIHINFRNEGGHINIPYRNSGYDTYIPTKDLRNGYPNPETSLANNNDSYYCIIEVTTPDCSNWDWSTRIPNGGSGNVEIHLPRGENIWDVRLVIKYYEKCSNGTYSTNYSTLQYGYESSNITGFLYGNPTTFIELIPTQENNCYSFFVYDDEEISQSLDNIYPW